jgi:hypothetical protein
MLIFLTTAFITNGEPSDYQIIRSKPADDLTVQVAMRKMNGVADAGASIEYGWFTLTNAGCLVYLPKEEYRCSIQLFDSNSNSLPLRMNFKDLGKNFLNLKYPSSEQAWNAIENTVAIRPAHGTQSAAGEVVFAGQARFEGRSLASPEELFQMEGRGLYRLRLQFQAYTSLYRGGQVTVYKLVRFDPIEITVAKE